MKHIPEKQRKFTDQIAIKTYRSLSPSDFIGQSVEGGPWVSIDQQIVLSGKEKITREFSQPSSSVVLIMLEGKLSYEDSFGFKRKLIKGTLLAMANGSGSYGYTIKNGVSHTDAEFLEIQLGPGADYDGIAYLLHGGIPEQNTLYQIIRQPGIKMSGGIFSKNTIYPLSQPSGQLVLFVLRGKLTINSLQLGALDTLVTETSAEPELKFSKDSAILLIEIHSQDEPRA